MAAAPDALGQYPLRAAAQWCHGATRHQRHHFPPYPGVSAGSATHAEPHILRSSRQWLTPRPSAPSRRSGRMAGLPGSTSPSVI